MTPPPTPPKPIPIYQFVSLPVFVFMVEEVRHEYNTTAAKNWLSIDDNGDKNNNNNNGGKISIHPRGIIWIKGGQQLWQKWWWQQLWVGREKLQVNLAAVTNSPVISAQNEEVWYLIQWWADLRFPPIWCRLCWIWLLCREWEGDGGECRARHRLNWISQVGGGLERRYLCRGGFVPN